MRDSYHIVIVGGGIAGISAAREIAHSESRVDTLLITAEDRPPYKRTKISKNISTGFSRDAFALEAEEWYGAGGIDLAVGASASDIDTVARKLVLQDGRTVGFEKLILATGGNANWPEGLDPTHPRLHRVRSAADAERLMAAMRGADSALVAGMGVLGVEVAEQLSKMGKSVTLVGRSHALMPRELNLPAADRLRSLFESNGVKLVFGSDVTSVRAGSAAVDIRMDRSESTVDHAIFCIGMSPSVDLARNSGLAVRSGILVDEYLRTNVAGVFACGDAAEHPRGYRTHLWHAAELQGEVAAANALGARRRYDKPRFRLKCEVFGHYFFSTGIPDNQSEIERSEHRLGDAYVCFYLRAGNLESVVMVDDPEHAKEYQQAVRDRWSFDRLKKSFLTR